MSELELDRESSRESLGRSFTENPSDRVQEKAQGGAFREHSILEEKEPCPGGAPS